MPGGVAVAAAVGAMGAACCGRNSQLLENEESGLALSWAISVSKAVSAAAKALRDSDALMVVEEGKPVGVITRHDVLGFLSEGPRRR